ncbi:ABC transporter ATP-binding protein [Actinospica sp.]|jgi:NitT/TauT family transport system ATP-binding protein|uniref:ABC transporter ATP-binding protein n=1 Tax=Actinospica sp. TaxID=1872142 RepID=UPI002B7B509A|nr:ABC transporter ATP-binding protein [Actinospica sp.]HWG24770.1 ABC transporter ATP-binding protein [Actinospica sp.]
MRSSIAARDAPASGNAPPLLELRSLTKRFADPKQGARTVVEGFDLELRPGEFCALIGPTGCGKSTVLSMIAGLERPSGGIILADGAELTGTDPRTGFVFQNDAVFPWKTVLGNVAAGPRFRGAGRHEAGDRALDWIRRVGLSGFEQHYPHQLSGGMRKRVALAQTFVNHPRILLMDEPFSGLDAQTRQIMAGELLGLWEALGASVLFVTHDLEEAIALADRVVVLTARPATVKEEFVVDLPRPRSPREIRFHPRFVELHEEIWSSLSGEVQIAYDRATTVI